MQLEIEMIHFTHHGSEIHNQPRVFLPFARPLPPRISWPWRSNWLYHQWFCHRCCLMYLMWQFATSNPSDIKVQVGRTSCLLLMLILRILTNFAVLIWNSQHLQKSVQGLPKTLQGNIIHGFLSSFPWKIWLRDYWLFQFDSQKLVVSLRMENLLQKYILYKYIHTHRIHGAGIYIYIYIYIC